MQKSFETLLVKRVGKEPVGEVLVFGFYSKRESGWAGRGKRGRLEFRRASRVKRGCI